MRELGESVKTSAAMPAGICCERRWWRYRRRATVTVEKTADWEDGLNNEFVRRSRIRIVRLTLFPLALFERFRTDLGARDLV